MPEIKGMKMTKTTKAPAHALKAGIEKNIAALVKSETTTKEQLAIVSRDMLPYVMDTNDIGMVNRLCDVLTPMNKATAFAFFGAFLPWKQDGKAFGKKLAGKEAIAKRVDAIVAFLKVEENNIWTWASDNVEVSVKPKNYANKLSKLVERSLADENEGLNVNQVIQAVIAGGVDIADLMASVDAAKSVIEAIKADALEGAEADETEEA